MSDTKHTAEPWEIKSDQAYVILISKNPLRYAVVNGLDGHINAFRIVACVNACTGMADPEKEIAALRAEVERAYSMLEACNVPRERAKSVANGIDVLSTRFAKAETGWNMERAALRAAAEKAREALKRISVYGTHMTTACKTLDGEIVPSEEKKNFYALVADSALAALEEVLG